MNPNGLQRCPLGCSAQYAQGGQYEKDHLARPHVECPECGRMVVDVYGQMSRHIRRFHGSLGGVAP